MGYILFMIIGTGAGIFIWKADSSFFAKIPLASKYKEALIYIVSDKNFEKEKAKLWKKNILLFLSCFILAALLAGILEFSAEKKEIFLKEVKRPEVGEGELIYSLEAVIEGKIQGLDIELLEREPTKEEAEKVFKQTYFILKERILGKNQVLNQIEYNVELPEYVEETGCTVYWSSDNTERVSTSGEVKREGIKETTFVKLLAECSYGEYCESYEFDVGLLPIQYTEEEELIYHLEEKIREEEKDQRKESVFQLPEKIEEKEVIYQKPSTSQSFLFFFLGIVIAVLSIIKRNEEILKQSKEKERCLLKEYPEIISKMTLLIGAGMTIRKAWEKIVFDYQKRGIYHSAYEEMKITYYQIESGLPEGKAYQIFGKRCRMHRYRKLGNMLEQNIRKGTAGLLEELKQEVQEALEDRKALAFRMGEEASTKLLMPMILLLGVVLIICIAPALMTF